MRMILLSLILALIFPFSVAEAIDAIVVKTTVKVSYTEPIINANGSSLVDLLHTNVHYDIGNGPVKPLDGEVEAVSVNGGSAITVEITIPVIEGTEKDAKIWATATDSSGNEGPKSPIITKRIDLLPPGAPK